MKPRLLDLFCGAGGAAMGYHRAGFEVVGVDIRPQPRYPFEFHQSDVFHWFGWAGINSFDAIHASPPCQRFSPLAMRNGNRDEHPDLIAETRELLEATGLPYVIENVVGAPLKEPVILCGTAFKLFADGHRLRRHRAFECSWLPRGLGGIEMGCGCHLYPYVPVMDITGGGPTRKDRTDGGGGRPYKGTADQARRIMGIDWMTKAELNEAIPPAYTEFIGTQFMAHLKATVAA